jgi:UDP-N-acetylmuramoylalanine--D-glutamate ligase
VVGITGTNGKSTTTALVHHIVKVGRASRPDGAGNIGLPILRQDPLPEGGVYVLELSSYQIDLTQSLDCDVSVLLNITPDHLDRYDGVEDYAASKARLFAMQSPEHVAIIATEDDYTRAIAGQITGERILVSSEDVKDQSGWPSLQGPHNAQNVAAAVAAVRALGISDDVTARALTTYAGLPHRMERVAEKNGVLFVNDSKATNPTSTAPALAAYPAVHWILGGLAKSTISSLRAFSRSCEGGLYDRRGRADVRALLRGSCRYGMRDAGARGRAPRRRPRAGRGGAVVARLRLVRPVQGL